MIYISNLIYDKDVYVIKSYGTRYKLTFHKSLRRKGFEFEKDKIDRSRGINNKKLLESIARSRSKVQEYALCNDWQYFVTFTIDGKKYDRFDLKKYKKDFSQFINNFNRGRQQKVKYVIIPEKHENGAWHMHAIFMGLSAADLKEYTYEYPWPKTAVHSEGAIPNYIREKIDTGNPIYYWEEYEKRFGYNVFDVVQDKNKVSSYILKYFTKNLSKSIKDLNSNLYYPSHGLSKARELKRGRFQPTKTTSDIDIKYDYETEYIKIKWFDKSEENLDMMRSIVKVNYNSFCLFRQQNVKLDRNKIKIEKNRRLNLQRMEELSLNNSAYWEYILIVHNLINPKGDIIC